MLLFPLFFSSFPLQRKQQSGGVGTGCSCQRRLSWTSSGQGGHTAPNLSSVVKSSKNQKVLIACDEKSFNKAFFFPGNNKRDWSITGNAQKNYAEAQQGVSFVAQCGTQPSQQETGRICAGWLIQHQRLWEQPYQTWTWCNDGRLGIKDVHCLSPVWTKGGHGLPLWQSMSPFSLVVHTWTTMLKKHLAPPIYLLQDCRWISDHCMSNTEQNHTYIAAASLRITTFSGLCRRFILIGFLFLLSTCFLCFCHIFAWL